jgi:hypothetical protein
VGVVVWIDAPPKVKVDASGVTLSYSSNGKEYVRRIPRAVFRAHLEDSMRALNNFEIAERDANRVVGLRGGAAHS